MSYWQEINPPEDLNLPRDKHEHKKRKIEILVDFYKLSREEAEKQTYRELIKLKYEGEDLKSVLANRDFATHADIVASHYECGWITIKHIPITGLDISIEELVDSEHHMLPFVFYLKRLKEIGLVQYADQLIFEVDWLDTQPELSDVLDRKVCSSCGEILENYHKVRSHLEEQHPEKPYTKTDGDQ